MNPSLNWRELAVLIDRLRPEIEGLFVDRIVVPERSSFPGGYLKGEWALRLTGRNRDGQNPGGTLLFSIRPRHPYLIWHPSKGPRAAPTGTHSAFDLSLSKHLKGLKLIQIETLPHERTALLKFRKDETTTLGLVLVFIPAVPEALLVELNEPSVRNSKEWQVLSRSKNSKETSFRIPDGSQAPLDLPLRFREIESPELYARLVENELSQEAFELRLQTGEKTIKQKLKQAEDRLRQSLRSREEALAEKDWQKLGDLLKYSQTHSPTSDPIRTVLDYTTGEQVTLSCDPKLSDKEQVEKFYQNARRRKKRISEAESRMGLFKESIQKLEKTLTEKPTLGDWKALEQWEKNGGGGAERIEKPGQKPTKKGASWWGKSFVSKDGLPLWVGRDKTENLELTFKFARGNDLWLHVRGRPGAHVVIPLPPQKSAPLETLLDAAQLVLHYSGGDHWGKTEVDYTYKKHVKRIKDSSEASYTHNKTLLIEPDPIRLKSLLGQAI